MRTLILICIILTFGGCVDVPQQDPKATGDSGEILVYIPEEYRGQGIEEEITDILDNTIPGLFRKEPMFDLAFEKEKTPDKILHRNVIEFDIAEGNNPEVFTKKSNLNARDQHHIIVYAKSVDNAIELINDHAQNIKNSFNGVEYNRLVQKFRRKRNDFISNKIYDKQRVSIDIPTIFDDFKYNSEEFSMAVGAEKRHGHSGYLIIQEFIMMMQFPDKGDSVTFTKDGLVWQANNYLQTWAKFKTNKERQDAFLQITDDIPVYSHKTTHDGFEAMELRGNMSTVDSEGNDVAFGGYFIALAVRDTEHNRIVLSIGMVNVPRDFKYREYIRKMKVIVYSMDF